MKRKNLLIGTILNIVVTCCVIFITGCCLGVYTTGTATTTEIIMTVILFVLAGLFLAINIIVLKKWKNVPKAFAAARFFVYALFIIALGHAIITGLLIAYVFYLDYFLLIPIAIAFALPCIPIIVDVCLENGRAAKYLAEHPEEEDKTIIIEDKQDVEQKNLNKGKQKQDAMKKQITTIKTASAQKTVTKSKISDVEALELKLKKLMYMKEAEIITEEEYQEIRKNYLKEML